MSTGFPSISHFLETTVSTPGNLPAVNNLIYVSITGTYNLPPINPSLADGFVLWVKNTSGGSVTLAPTSPDTLDAGYTTLTTGQAELITVLRPVTGTATAW